MFLFNWDRPELTPHPLSPYVHIYILTLPLPSPSPAGSPGSQPGLALTGGWALLSVGGTRVQDPLMGIGIVFMLCWGHQDVGAAFKVRRQAQGGIQEILERINHATWDILGKKEIRLDD